MKTSSATERTAAQAYDQHAAAITAALNHLKDGLAKHKREAHANPKNWCYAGDLDHVRELLERVASFINGEEE